MRKWLQPETLCQEIWLAAAVIGVLAGVIGPSDVGWNVGGIAMGGWLSALWIWLRA